MNKGDHNIKMDFQKMGLSSVDCIEVPQCEVQTYGVLNMVMKCEIL